MTVFSIIMLFCALNLLVFGRGMSGGNSKLINSSDLRRVKDKKGYASAMSKTYMTMGAGFAVSGIIGLVVPDVPLISIGIGVLSIVVFIILLMRLAKKYGVVKK